MNSTNPNTTEEKLFSLNDLKWIWSAITSGWYLFFICPLVIGLGGFFYSYKTTPKFVSKIEVLVKSNEVYDYQQSLRSNIGYNGLNSDIPNQIRVIKSFDLVKRTLSKLNFDVSYFIVGRLVTKEYFKDTPFKVDVFYLDKRLYEAPFEFKILDHEKYELSYFKAGEKIVMQHLFDEFVQTNDYAFNVHSKGEGNRFVIGYEENTHYQFVVHNENYWVNRVMSNLQIVNIPNTSILQLMLTDEIPRRAQTILDTLANEYIYYTVENDFKINENSLNYINTQLGEVVGILDSIELEVEQVRDTNNILNLKLESSAYFSGMMEAEMKEKKLELQLKSMFKLMEYITDESSENIQPPSFYMSDHDPYWNSALSKFAELRMNKIEMEYIVKGWVSYMWKWSC